MCWLKRGNLEFQKSGSEKKFVRETNFFMVVNYMWLFRPSNGQNQWVIPYNF